MKRNHYLAWLLSGLCAFAAAGCDREDENIIVDPAPQYVPVSYAQTQCADRWGQATGTQQLVSTAQAYLTQRGLTLYQPQASVKGQAAVCNACSCPTGLVLEGSVTPADLPAVLALGFKQ